jgi:hypothetical protein
MDWRADKQELQPMTADILTRTTQVIDVLHAGGYIVTRQPADEAPHPLTTLHHADGAEAVARLTAVRTALGRCTLVSRARTAVELVERWELRQEPRASDDGQWEMQREPHP